MIKPINLVNKNFLDCPITTVAKQPMVGVVMPTELRERLSEWQAREHRNSRSEFLKVLLEYGAWKLDQVGSLNALLEEMEEPPGGRGAKVPRTIKRRVKSRV